MKLSSSVSPGFLSNHLGTRVSADLPRLKVRSSSSITRSRSICGSPVRVVAQNLKGSLKTTGHSRMFTSLTLNRVFRLDFLNIKQSSRLVQEINNSADIHHSGLAMVWLRR